MPKNSNSPSLAPFYTLICLFANFSGEGEWNFHFPRINGISHFYRHWGRVNTWGCIFPSLVTRKFAGMTILEGFGLHLPRITDISLLFFYRHGGRMNTYGCIFSGLMARKFAGMKILEGFDLRLRKKPVIWLFYRHGGGKEILKCASFLVLWP